MGEACSTYVWGRKKVHTGFWRIDLRKRNHLEDLDIDGRIILKLIFEKWNGRTEWIDLAQNRDRRRALVNMVINLRVP
jgi:hypothetical protein